MLLRTTALHKLATSITALALGAAVFPSIAQADDWLGTASADWFNAANWSGAVPDAATNVFLDTASPNATLINGAAALSALAVTGNTGTGSLTISNGGTLASGDGHIGAAAGGTGTVAVTGVGSQWSSSGALYVGNAGTGTLTVSDSAQVLVGTGAAIGVDTGSSGTVAVTGAGSILSSVDEVFVGVKGAGAMTISDGGAVESTDGTIGGDTNGTGAVTVTGAGSSWNGSAITVGMLGTGTLAIAEGGALYSTSGVIGSAASGTGTATVTGTGSLWDNTGNLTVGQDGTGSLTVSDAGQIDVASEARIGFGAGSNGAVTVTGAGSQLNTDTLLVGYLGTGALTIADSGAVSANTTTIGGTATVSGATLSSTLVNVGGTGGGVLAVAAGGIVNATTTSADSGTISVSGAGATLSSTNIALGADSDGALTLSDGGAVVTDNLTLGGVGAGTVNIGAAAGDAAGASGTLTATALTFSDGTLVFNHTDTGYLFATDMSGATGAISQIGGATSLTGNSAGFTGLTTVSGGSLSVNGTLGGPVTVSGGSLGGTGSILDTVTIASGGTFAPGNSIGTTTVTSVTFDAGSFYAAEVESGGTSDLINASGIVTINGGTVQVIASPDYLLGAPYTIITATGGVVGTFDAATSQIFLTPTLTYDFNNVFVELAIASFDSAAVTVNQKAAAVATDALGAGNVLYDAIAVLATAAQAQAAFDAVSGEIHASAKTALVEDSRFVHDAANNRIRAAFGSVGADRDANATTGLWVESFGAIGRTDSDGNAAALSRSVGGIFVGVDGEVADDVTIGVLAGYSHSAFDADARSSSGEADTFHLAAYGGTQWGKLALRAGGAYSWHALAFDRSVAISGFSDSLSSSYDAATGQLFAEVGYGMTMGTARFEPFVKLAHVRHATEGFTESGGAAALTGASDVFSTTFTTLGLRGETEVAFGETTKARATGMIGWRHGFGSSTPSQRLAFAGGTAFTVYGAPVARDALLLEAGLDFDVRANTTLGVAYSGQLGTGMYDHALRANLGVTF
ncbi:autotransporter domain-containing protein [Breoghania sp. L-A4]|uniref:autotransporter outer membrane beta-barrel domain-containing protein n=1 Tax=Breoghania sp. L-A4 TaxID=2304600 RepID=UPI0013C337CD|nr:autotransporter domain-containing protein [Breoghania sp. L-A4]